MVDCSLRTCTLRCVCVCISGLLLAALTTVPILKGRATTLSFPGGTSFLLALCHVLNQARGAFAVQGASAMVVAQKEGCHTGFRAAPPCVVPHLIAITDLQPLARPSVAIYCRGRHNCGQGGGPRRGADGGFRHRAAPQQRAADGARGRRHGLGSRDPGR